MSGLRGMTGAALLVVGTLCLGLLLVLGTVCALVLRGMGVPVELQVIASSLLTGVTALLAKSYHDKNAEPVEVVPVAPDPVWVEGADTYGAET